MMPAAPELPDAAFVVHDDADGPRPAVRSGDRFTTADMEIALDQARYGLRIAVSCPSRGLSRIALRWHRRLPDSALYLGDAWERGYGDLQWRHRQPERILPWYWLAHDPQDGSTLGMGVRVRPHAFCSWTVDEDGITLWLDVRSGGSPVLLGERVLDAATVVEIGSAAGESPWQTHRRLCTSLCSDPLPARGPVVGCNNWYYAYGVDFGPAEVQRDAETIVELADGHPVAPYCVVDAGWSPGGVAPGGPWTAGIPGLFDDMAALADGIAQRGARPGIWFRPAALSTVDREERLRAGPRPVPEQPLDLTLDENLAAIGDDVSRLVGWGYELIKHDFSTYDAFGRWGSPTTSEPTEPGWRFADPRLTNAEVLLGLYRTIRASAGGALVLGCNTVGHLAAGLVDVQRTGDDTSGRSWERTRRMGVNTLAFRMAQHGSFFTADADCVPCTPRTPWTMNRRFLDLVARSGTALFVSVDPKARTTETDADLRAALRLALDGGEPGGVEALDWLHTTAPRRWNSVGGIHEYTWSESAGVWPLAV
ncbi:hypothetical protein OHA27_27855 [Streptomyces sp. NBC_01619]|uniref:hypothetical protein n=1 Tax=Streptomyces sp. NBC_01619 TaxID=2975901 RepID=UPI00225B2242|nr:hypothetical protein [Streptomyces sp. NBC_01619]MCX4514072.1 hypothetical protein [Streptomyces sp. NBC_01619]